MVKLAYLNARVRSVRLPMVVFLEVVVQWLDAASTARQHTRVQSRHPGKNPKLAGKTSPATLSYPAFEPLTERHAF